MRATVAGALWDHALQTDLIVRSPVFGEGFVRFFTHRDSERDWTRHLQRLAYDGFVKNFHLDTAVAPVFIRGEGLSADVALLHRITETLAQSAIIVTMGAVSPTEIVIPVKLTHLEDSVQALKTLVKHPTV